MDRETRTKEERRKSIGTKANGSSSINTMNENGKASSPKAKRRKVNHACLYCRRSHMTCDLERPCTRCIKRNIGHLCHDEPREPKLGDTATNRFINSLDQQQVDQQLVREAALGSSLAVSTAIQQAQQSAGPSASLNVALSATPQQYSTYTSDWKFNGQNQFHDVHTFHPSYMFNAHEVTNEYNLLNDFLSTSLLDEGAIFSNEEPSLVYPDNLQTSPANAISATKTGGAFTQDQGSAQQLLPGNIPSEGVKRSSSAAPADKEAQETYYMTAADPAGSDAPDARMNKLLQAKYDAGLLRPFNYVKGYARLNKYMESHMQVSSRQKILRQLDKFRPKFRERMQSLTDVELVVVEMWFERCLMEYDRVFASMAVPACCWRRTGEIFRGNKEMAELIHVPIESLRDAPKGKLAIHDIIVETHLVSYWEKFGAIAFDRSQKAMLTSCSLKCPDPNSPGHEISCCFSFTIRRDEHFIPSLIVGNFLPTLEPRK